MRCLKEGKDPSVERKTKKCEALIAEQNTSEDIAREFVEKQKENWSEHSNDRTRLFERRKPIEVQAFFAQAAVKALDVGVLRRLAGIDEVQFNAMIRRPTIQGRPRSSGPLSTTRTSG